MTTLVHIRKAQPPRSPELGSGGTVSAFPNNRLEPGPFTRRCPECGRVDQSDSELAGMCEYCPGLVQLQAD
jgi:hypothetical protein